MAGDPERRHLYMVDESSLASTCQMQAFMEKIGSQDRVLLIGELGVANRDLGTIAAIDGTKISASMDGDAQKSVTFDGAQMRHFDHGYAVTSHSSQGLTSERVLINMDTTVHPELINTRFAYVSVSRASLDAHIYTNDAAALGERLSTDVSKRSAVNAEFRSEPKVQEPTERKENTMNNSREQSQEDQRRQFQAESNFQRSDTQTAQDTELRHNAPIQTALREDANGYDWKRETGDIQSYQHRDHHGWLHIDLNGSFYDRQALPITREAALENAGHTPSLAISSEGFTSSVAPTSDQSFSL